MICTKIHLFTSDFALTKINNYYVRNVVHIHLLRTFSQLVSAHQIFRLQILRSCAALSFVTIFITSPVLYCLSIGFHLVRCSHYFIFLCLPLYTFQTSQPLFPDFLTYVCHTHLFSYHSYQYSHLRSFQ